jgi:hypothetical protein
VRLLLHDGFDTVVSEPPSVIIGELPPEVAILSPRDGEMVVRDGSVRLWGAAIAAGRHTGERRGHRRRASTPSRGQVGDSSRAAVTSRVVDPETDYGKEGPSLPEQRLRGSGSGGQLRRRR